MPVADTRGKTIFCNDRNEFTNEFDSQAIFESFRSHRIEFLIVKSDKLWNYIDNNPQTIDALHRAGSKGMLMSNTQKDGTRRLVQTIAPKLSNPFTGIVTELFNHINVAPLENTDSTAGMIQENLLARSHTFLPYPTWTRQDAKRWVVSCPSLLYSTPKTSAGRLGENQEFHYDAPFVNDAEVHTCRNISCICCLKESSLICVLDGEPQEIVLFSGDVIFFWGNRLLHQGVGYSSPNARLFWYFDYHVFNCQYDHKTDRTPGNTYRRDTSGISNNNNNNNNDNVSQDMLVASKSDNRAARTRLRNVERLRHGRHPMTVRKAKKALAKAKKVKNFVNR